MKGLLSKINQRPNPQCAKQKVWWNFQYYLWNSAILHVNNSYKTVLTWLWQTCVHIHHPRIHCHTGKFCIVVVHKVRVLISRFKNQIKSTQTHVLQYFFMFITYLYSVQRMKDIHSMKRKHFALVWVLQYLYQMQNYLQENTVYLWRYLFLTFTQVFSFQKYKSYNLTYHISTS